MARKVKPGIVCLFLPNNEYGFKESSILAVVPIKRLNSLFNLRRNRIWSCAIYYDGFDVAKSYIQGVINNSNIITVYEKYLVPIIGLDENIVLRYPDDIPEFNNPILK